MLLEPRQRSNPVFGFLVLSCGLGLAAGRAPAADQVPREVVELGAESVTVETATTVNGAWTDSDGFLACVAGASAKNRLHEGNLEAAKNLRDMTALSGNLVLVGHGWPGQVCTGYGDRCGFPPDRAWYYSDGQEPWRTAVEPLNVRGPGSLLVLGCNTGADDGGARLVKAIATLTHWTVKAPVGLVWCRFADRQVSVEDRSPAVLVWQVGEPEAAVPKPISLPLMDPQTSDHVILYVDDRPVDLLRSQVDIRDVTMQISFPESGTALPARTAEQVNAAKTWRREAEVALRSALVRSKLLVRATSAGFQVDPARLMALINLASPLLTSDVTSAIEVSRLTFTIKLPDERSVKKTFRILNGVILVDDDSVGKERPLRHVYYYLAKGFPQVRFTPQPGRPR